MAQFQIKLLTSALNGSANSGNFSNFFLETPITEFYSQETTYLDRLNIDPITSRQIPFSSKNTFCYTYDESLSMHQNAQKELTFSMDRKIFINNAWATNPFSSNIHIGSQLLLIDKYDNEYIFIVKKIDYVNKENNLTYKITCQDLFTYQMIRQNSGYTINNDDTSSEDYIGALTIDSWVVNHIIPECFISYSYLSLNQGLYITNDNQIKIFNGATQRLENVKKIIKSAYSEKTYPDLYVPIPFSVSGSNADAALIALGQEVGLMLNVFEHNTYNEGVRTGKFVKYFWFEPTKKSERVTGLTYSPKQDIQDFSFSHAGDSLTTILNVESSKTGSNTEESVTLLPSIPTFFADYFESQEWLNSKYYTGMFTQLCRNTIKVYSTNVRSDLERDLLGVTSIWSTSYQDPIVAWKEQMVGTGNKNGFVVTNDTGTWLYIPVWEDESADGHKTLNIPRFYDKINFRNDIADYANSSDITLRYGGSDGEVSTLNINFNDNTVALTIFSYHEETKAGTDGGTPTTEQVYDEPVDCYMNGGVIPAEFQGSAREVAIKIRINNDDGNPTLVNSADISLVFYREPSQEEIEFATVADQCPWLENKLIDFRYFYDHNIINRYEYATLIDTLYNNLRIVNGRLLFYSQAYYEALHNKTSIIAALTNDLDALGAACQADIVRPFAENGAIADDITAFDNAYTLYMNYQTSNQTQNSTIIGWSDTINEYWNKYWSAQQRFLKNIYNFTNYFYAPASSRDSHSVIYDDTITLNYNWLNADGNFSGEDINYVTFAKNQFTSLNKDFNLYDDNPNSITYGRPYVPIYNKENNQLLEIVDSSNVSNYYIAGSLAGSYFVCGDTNSTYKDWKIYYQYGAIVISNNENLFQKGTKCSIDFDENNKYDAFVYNKESLSEYDTTEESSSEKKDFTIENINGQSIKYRYTIVFSKKVATTSDNNLLDKALTKIAVTVSGNAATFELIPVDINLIKQYYLNDHSNFYCYTRDEKDIYTNQCTVFKKLGNKETLYEYLTANYTYAGLISTMQSVNNNVLRNTNEYNQLTDNEKKLFISYNYDAYNSDNKLSSEPVPMPPITDYYYYGPLYKLTTSEETKEDGTPIITGASRVNAKGQTISDYQDYLKNPDSTVVVANPDEYLTYQKLNYVTPDNENTYFRNVTNAGCSALIPSIGGGVAVGATIGAFATAGPAGWVAGGILGGLYLLMTGINSLCLAYSGFAPQKSGVCVADFKENRWTNESEYFENYSARDDLIYFKNQSDMQDRKIYKENLDMFPEGDQDCNYNFFEKVGFTYSSISRYIVQGQEGAKIYYKSKWYRPIKISDSINRYDSYKILLIPHVSGTADKVSKDDNISIATKNRYFTVNGFSNIMSSNNGRETTEIKNGDNVVNTLIHLNAYYHFPLNNNLNDINFSVLDWSTKIIWGLSDALTALGFSSKQNFGGYADNNKYLNDYILTVTYPNPNDDSETVTADVVVFIEEPFRVKLWKNASTYNGEVLYEVGNDAPVDFESKDDFTEGLITTRDTATNFIASCGFDPSTIYYRKYDYSYDRVYTLEQLKGLSNFAKYPTNTVYTLTNLTDNILTMNVPIILNRATFIQRGLVFSISVPDWDGNTDELRNLIGREWNIIFNNDVYQSYYQSYALVLQTFTIDEDTNKSIAHFTFTCDAAMYEEGMDDKWKNSIDSIGCSSISIPFNDDTTVRILKNDKYVINSIESVEANAYNFTADSVFDKESASGFIGKVSITQHGIEYSSNYSWIGRRRQAISGLSNGTFWYLYHDSTQYPTLMEKAAAIETQLQQYWGSAYNASLYCEYFLPESWQSYNNSYSNYFASLLMSYNPKTNWVSLSNKLIPHVKIYVENGTADLPSYQFKFIQDTNDVLTDTTQRNTTQKQDINRSIEYLNAATVFHNNSAVKNAMAALGEDLNDWSVQRLNDMIKTTYYYADQGGLKWNNLIPTLAKTNTGLSNYKELDGLYVMFYKVFRHSYSNRTLPMYESLLNEHNNIWKGIYESYPGVILENTYTNDDATTSTDLLNMARNYFADLSYPERQYNITVIDVAQLKGYEGQELELGDPIAVNAFEYYDDYDEIFNTLSQYLFITDISYTLRKEGDINLTVNAIKYQDKLIRNLAKLIREPRRA